MYLLLKETTQILITLLCPSQVNDLPTQLEKMDELSHLPGFRHDAKLIEETGKLYTAFSLHIEKNFKISHFLFLFFIFLLPVLQTTVCLLLKQIAFLTHLF